MHRDHVPEVPPAFHLLGSTPTTLNQGMVGFDKDKELPTEGSRPLGWSLRDIHIFTVQGHPEFTKDIVSKIVQVRSESGVLDEQMKADVLRREDWPHHGVNVVGRVIWGVLGFRA